MNKEVIIDIENPKDNDLISRQAVLKEFEKGTENLYDRIDKLPPVTQKSGKWIPVSERLPKDGTYLVMVERLDGKSIIGMRSFAKDLNKVNEFDFPKHKRGWYDYHSGYGYWEDTRVVAWMPLPKPYEPQERSDKE